MKRAGMLCALILGGSLANPCGAEVWVESPNGGESIAAGRQWPITWRCDESVERVTIAFSFTNGVFWDDIGSAECSGRQGRYLWTTPAISSRQCLIRITALADSTPGSDQSDGTFTIFPCALRMDYDGDCAITFIDLAALAREWLQCGNPYDPACAGNRPPQIVSAAPPKPTPGRSYFHSVTAFDPDGDPLTYGLVRAPAGMSIDSGTGTIVWDPPADLKRSAPLIVQVRDPFGATDLQAVELGTPGAPTSEQYSGAPVNGYPSLYERRLIVYANAVRMAPQQYRDRYMAGFRPDPSGILQTNAPVEPLYYEMRLGESARSHAEDMATNGCFQHDSCDGTAWSARIWSFYPQAGSIGENVAMGHPSAKAVVDAWLCDETGGQCAADGTLAAGHRTNMVNGHFRQIGTGYAVDVDVPWRKYWVQDFASNAPGSQPPTVAGCHDFLESGRTSFLLNYYDPSKQSPGAVQVVIDGQTHDMSLDLGTAAAGTYRLDVTRAGVCRDYYFLTTTAAGQTWRYPGPGVFITDGEGSCTGDYR